MIFSMHRTVGIRDELNKTSKKQTKLREMMRKFVRSNLLSGKHDDRENNTSVCMDSSFEVQE